MEEILSVFIQEAREQLSDMEAGLMRMEQGDHDPETLNGVFRAAHTIKGGSGVVELGLIEKFTHCKRARILALFCAHFGTTPRPDLTPPGRVTGALR
ncbi:MAG: Hpt domain-containing protein [Proteobacteria bacterium]|nr:Hpt domain-containing protein [Pseudomonadota bacterium]